MPGLERSEMLDDRSHQGKKLQPLVSSDRAMAITRLSNTLLSGSQSSEQMLSQEMPDVIEPVEMKKSNLVSDSVSNQSLQASALDDDLKTNQNSETSSTVTPVQRSIVVSTQDQVSNSVPLNTSQAISSSSEATPRSACENAESPTQKLPEQTALSSQTQPTPLIAQRSPSPFQTREPFADPVNASVHSDRLAVSQSSETQERRPTATHLERPQGKQQGTAITKIAPLVPLASASPGTAIEGVIKPVLQPEVRAMMSTPAPTIQVTIGRIEVRAITPVAPSPQPRSAPSTPRLSLHDYLKARNGGKG
jgi:hypothetical protein